MLQSNPDPADMHFQDRPLPPVPPVVDSAFIASPQAYEVYRGCDSVRIGAAQGPDGFTVEFSNAFSYLPEPLLYHIILNLFSG